MRTSTTFGSLIRGSGIVSATLLACASSAGGADLAGVEIHGFYSQGYIKSSSNEYLVDQSNHGSVDLVETGLTLGYQASDRLRLAGQVFGKGIWSGENQPVNSGTLTGRRGAQFTVDLAFAQYSFCDGFGVRAGRIKQPYGLYNEVRDLDVARAQAVLPQSVYDNRDREYNFATNGVSAYGNIHAGKAGSFDYQLYGGKTYMPADGTIGKQYGTADLGLSMITIKWTAGGMVFWNPPVDGLRLGFSYRQHHGQHADAYIRNDLPVPAAAPTVIDASAFDVDIDRVQNYLFSAEYVHDDFTLQAEYQRVVETRHLATLQTTTTLPGPFYLTQPYSLGDQHLNQEGAYLLATWQLNEKWLVGGCAAVWSADFNDRSGGNQNDYQRDYSLLARYDAKDWWVMKLEGHYVRGTGLLDVPNQQEGQLLNTTPITNERWFYVVARTTFSF